jgi:hypothetical protein
MGEASLLSEAVCNTSARDPCLVGNKASKQSLSKTAIDSLQYRQAAKEAVNIP